MSEIEHSPELYCPGCGYDLRALTADRCSECGLVIDRATMAHSDIPWTHRARIGRVSAFVRTIWFVFSKPHVLARQCAKLVNYRDAQLFRWIVVFLAAAPLCAAALVARWMIPVQNTVFNPLGPMWPLTPMRPQIDLLICLIAGASMWPIPSIAILLFIAAMTGMPSFFFQPRDLPIALQNRAIALSYYCCAPLGLLFIPVGLFGLAAAVQILELWTRDGWFEIAALSSVLGAFSLILTVPTFLYRSIQLLQGTTHCTLTRLLVSLVLLPVLWLIMAGLCLGLFPIIAGLIRLMIESLTQ